MRTREELEKSINDFPIKVGKRLFFDDIPIKQEFFMLLIDYYQLYVYPHKSLELYELPLMETAVSCMKYYDASKGEFLHLFNSEMAKAMRRAQAKERSDRMRQGLKLMRDEQRLIQRMVAFAVKRNLDFYDADSQKIIAAALNVSRHEVARLVFINDDAVALPDVATNDNVEAISLLDLQVSKDQSVQEMLEETDAVREQITRIDRVFVSMRDSQQRALSMYLTALVIKAYDYDMQRVELSLQGKALYSRDVCEYCVKHGKLPTRKQIGAMCNIAEPSVSRTIKIFKERLKSSL